MTTFNNLKDGGYLFRGYTLGFAEGRRESLRYARESGFGFYTRLNQNGPEPFEYLGYAKSDLNSKHAQGAINSLCNAKRAMHLIIDTLIEVWGLRKAYAKANFPTKLEIMKTLDAFPVRLLDNLNKKRNLVEHDYISIETDEAKDFIEVTEMFLMLAFPFLKHATISAFVGIEHDERCLEWAIDTYNCQIVVYEITCNTFIETPVGQVYYDISIDKMDRKLVQIVNIAKSNQDSWLPQLDLFVYLTKRNAHFLPQHDGRGDGLYESRTGLHVL